MALHQPPTQRKEEEKNSPRSGQKRGAKKLAAKPPNKIFFGLLAFTWLVVADFWRNFFCFLFADNKISCTFVSLVPAKPLNNAQIRRGVFFNYAYETQLF